MQKQAGWIFALLLCGAVQAHACSIQDRIDLSRAGYSKPEIEDLCLKNAAPASAAQPARPDPVSVLKSASYDGSDDPALQEMWHPRNHCEFLDDKVMLNNIKKTFGGYKSKVVPYREFWAASQKLLADRQKGGVSAHVMIMAMGFSNANETCYVQLARRIRVAPDEFDKVEVEVRQEHEGVLNALRAMGVDMEKPLN
jgi:hypothetical protein